MQLMKKLLSIFSIFFLFLFMLSFLIPFLIKKDEIVQFVKNEVSKRIEGDLVFDNEVKIHFFPNPSLSIKNLKFTGRGFRMTSLKMNISSDWVSLLKKKPKLNKIELFHPKLDFNFNLFLLSSFDNEYLKKINYQSSSIKTDKYLEWVDYLEVHDGSIEILEGKDLHKFKNVEMRFLNMEGKKIDGDFFYDNISSNLSFNLIADDDLNKIKIRLKHNFIDRKSESLIEGFLYPLQKPLLFEGSFNSDLVDAEEFANFKKKLSFIKKNTFLYKVSDKKNRLFPLSIKASSKIKKLKYKSYLLENITFSLNLENEILRIENFNAKHLNANLILNTEYNLDSKKIKGLLLMKDFNIPEEVFGETKYDIFGGTGNMTAKFDSNLKNKDLQSIINKTNIQGKFFFEDSMFRGMDTKKIANKIDSLKKFSDFFSLMQSFNPDDLSSINEISGDFLVSKGILKFKEVIIKNENFKIFSSGNYEINENYLNLINKIKLKTNVYKNLPDFQIELSGTSENYSTKFKIDEIRKFFFSSGILKLGPLKSLKIPMKKNNSIDLEEIFKLF